MLRLMEKDKELLQILTNIQIETSDFMQIDCYNQLLSSESKNFISEYDIDLFIQHPRFLLQACNMHFNEFICCQEGRATNIVERTFYSPKEINCIWDSCRFFFHKPLLLKGKMLSDNQDIYRIDAKILTLLGERLLHVLDSRGLLPDLWRQMYLSDTLPPEEREGVYSFDVFPERKMVGCGNNLDKMLLDPYFRSVDVSNLSLSKCNEIDWIKNILSNCQDAVVFVEKRNGQYIKRLCWKWKETQFNQKDLAFFE